MPATYFDNFPLVQYSGVSVRDITRRARFVEVLRNNPNLFLPYLVEEGQKPEDIAYYYYGSTDYTWLVLLANNIIDPYHDWPLSSDNFANYLIAKYQAQSGKISYDVVAWTQDLTITDNIVYYYTQTSTGQTLTLSPTTFSATYLSATGHTATPGSNGTYTVVDQGTTFTWTPLRIYDYENTLNENKRNITLVDKQYLTQITNEFSSIIIS